MTFPPPPWWLLPAVLLAYAILTLNSARSQQTSDQWFQLVVELDRQYARVGNEADRRFIRKMINELSASDDALPTRAQAHWLLSIKTELERRR